MPDKSVRRGPLSWALAGTALLALIAGAGQALGDEGMWTFDNPPLRQLKDAYDFLPTQAWLDHVRLSSARLNDGGSGSFVSPDGLVLTNDHVARGQLQKVSSPQKDYVKDGFLAATRAEELKCPDLELNVLKSMEDVTARVQGAARPGMSEKDGNDARKAEIGKIEKESLDRTGLRSDVITMYAGGEYWLYRYKKYTDLRLVFAPEVGIAFFGGDPDNFTFPRHDLDIALFRVYENDRPISSPDFLKWNVRGAADGDLVFVSGNPGSTDRLYALSQLEFLRDFSIPARIADLKRRLTTARAYSARGTEEARQAASLIFGAENSLKVQSWEYLGLKDPALISKKAGEEQDFRRRVAGTPALQTAYGDAWVRLAAAEKARADRFLLSTYRRMPGYRLPSTALSLVRYVAEVSKPDGKRLKEFHEAGLESLRFRLLSSAPFYSGLEEAMFADELRHSLEKLGADDPFVRAALSGESPEALAHAIFAGTKLADPKIRKSLLEGGPAAIAASVDPLIVFTRRIDPILRQEREWLDDTVEAVEHAAGEKIGKARFAIYGKTVNPDATFTLRLSYGKVAGFPMNGTRAPSKTTFYGLYDRSASFDDKPPFNLPERYVEGRTKLDLSTPLDFVSTCDVIGGNSGSPVIDRAGELVGLIFDGNIESLVGRFVYDGTANRSVAVHTAGMIEALRKLYGADAIVRELVGQ